MLGGGMDENLYQHCLRPVFTENIIKDLQRRCSLNIYGAPGQGRRRLLEDIQKFQWDSNTKVLMVDMKNHRDSHESFLQALWQQMGMAGKVPKDLSGVLAKFKQANSSLNLIFLLHHFDSLLNNATVHHQFNVKFFDNLNAIRNESNMSLLCVTEKKHSLSVIFIEEKTHRASWLNLESKRLTGLTFDEIRYEIKQRLETLSGEELQEFAHAVYAHIAPYQFLMYCCDNYLNHANDDIELSQRLKLWKQQYNQDHPSLTLSNFDYCANSAVCAYRSLRMGQFLNPLWTGIKVFFVDLPTAVFEWWTTQKTDEKKPKRTKRK